jgi:hypothetical protein
MARAADRSSEALLLRRAAGIVFSCAGPSSDPLGASVVLYDESQLARGDRRASSPSFPACLNISADDRRGPCIRPGRGEARALSVELGRGGGSRQMQINLSAVL